MRKRREMDVSRLLASKFRVSAVNDSMTRLTVELPGPADSPYEGGIFRVSVELPEEYPLKSPSIGFETKVFHPNVDEGSGSICLDVINQTWSPMFDLVNIFDSFLPQLLLYPNPSDPLNGAAASLMMKNPEAYNRRVREMVLKVAPLAERLSDISREELSELSETSDLDPDLL